MKRPTGKGRVFERADEGFDAAVLGTSFSGRDPGCRPHVLVQANDVADVIAAVKRAVREDLKISICSGGHSWAQNHIRDGGMLIDMARLNAIEVDGAAMRARVGPGCWSLDLDKRLATDGLFFPVAHAPDVCLGGFLLQGGFGWASRALGMACESVIAVDVVLADGTLVHANEHENADLYWAARGAGPGFFGVVVRYHLKLHRRPRAVGMAIQIFRMEHLEDVFRWADAIGPSVPRSVEFQMLITPHTLAARGPGIEVFAPVLAPTWREAHAALAFLRQSPIRKKASLTTPLIPISTMMMSRIANRTHFPPQMRWCVDNMWTNAPIDALMPGIKRVAETLPPAPSHALWLNWYPPATRPDMAFSKEANRYFALYGEWRRAEDDAAYRDWATARMREMAPLSAGIQLADENLGRRPAWFMAQENLKRLDAIRAAYDPQGRFNAWMGRPDGGAREPEAARRVAAAVA